MKNKGNRGQIWVFILVLALYGAGIRVFADTEIDLGDLTKPAPTAAPKPAPTAAPAAAPAQTPTPASDEIQMEDDTQAATQTAPEPTPTALVFQGHLKMKEYYDAGKKYYLDQDYDKAISYWTQAVKMKDPDTPKMYYAEANAMLGIIYQYHLIHLNKAYWYYKKALYYEPHNQTAKRHIKQVYKYRNRKD